MTELKSTIYRALWLSESQCNALGTLCKEANSIVESKTADNPPSWVLWLDAISRDAHSLLEKITHLRRERKNAGDTKKQINKSVAYLRESTNVTSGVRNEVANSLGTYRVPTEISFDAKSSKLMQQLKVPATPAISTLRLLIIATAISNGDWQHLRRCQWSKCGRFFCDTPGRRASKHCPGTNHLRRDNQSKLKKVTK